MPQAINNIIAITIMTIRDDYFEEHRNCELSMGTCATMDLPKNNARANNVGYDVFNVTDFAVA